MTSCAPFLSLGDLEIKGDRTQFFGEVYLYYLAASREWTIKEFHGVMTQDGVKYRGRWTEGADFQIMEALFKADPRLVELADEKVKRRVTYD